MDHPYGPPNQNPTNPDQNPTPYPAAPGQACPPPPPPPVSRRPAGRGCLQVLLGFGLALGLVAVLAAVGIGLLGRGCAALCGSFEELSRSGGGGFVPSIGRITERVLEKGCNPDGKRIAVVRVRGVIGADGGRGQGASAESIVQELKAAAEDDAVAAVVLDMDTPGGEVVASDEILRQVGRCRQAGRPVVACMRSMGASGGYFIASGCDWIIANRMTFTGSIGVIISSYQIGGLLDKIGVVPEVYRSGRMKDMLNPARERTEQERAYVQSLVMDTYREFCRVVADGRSRYRDGRSVADSVFGDGRVLSGAAALREGLVDQLGYFDDAVRKARELGNAPDAEVVAFSYAPRMWDLILSMRGGVPPLRLEGLLSGGGFSLQPGRLYFLPAECIGAVR